MGPQSMFRGKYLPDFFQQNAPLYSRLVERHGKEKVYKVYDYFFDFMSRMCWGQWMVVDRVCPDVSMRQLFYWVVECIYQSDLFSQFRFVWRPAQQNENSSLNEVLCIECVAPTQEQMQRWQWFLPKADDGTLLQRYSLIDWFGRLRQDPKCDPDIDPSWLMLEATSEWGDTPEQRADLDAGD